MPILPPIQSIFKRKTSLATMPPTFTDFLKANRVFFIGFAVLTLIALYLILTRQVGDLLLFINKQRTPGRDRFFIFWTQMAEPVAYITILIMYLMVRYRTAVFSIVVGAAAGIVSAILKGFFQHARPLRWFYDNAIELWGTLALFDPNDYNNSWAYSSFPSGHAMSAFAIYSFIAFNAGRWKPAIGLVCILMAASVGFSRMYLLMHFMKDISVGGFLGVGIGIAAFYIQFRIYPQRENLDHGFLNRPVLAE
jgi:membrane-associated phospholipid phosphatase